MGGYSHQFCDHSTGCYDDPTFDADIKGSPALQAYFARLKVQNEAKKKKPRVKAYSTARNPIIRTNKRYQRGY